MSDFPPCARSATVQDCAKLYWAGVGTRCKIACNCTLQQWTRCNIASRNFRGRQTTQRSHYVQCGTVCPGPKPLGRKLLDITRYLNYPVNELMSHTHPGTRTKRPHTVTVVLIAVTGTNINHTLNWFTWMLEHAVNVHFVQLTKVSQCLEK